MMQLLQSRFAFQMTYLRALIEGIPEDRMGEQPSPGMNPPSWILGHLAWAADLVPALAGGSSSLPKSWGVRFGTGTRPGRGRASAPYPSELMDALTEAHDRASRSAAQVDPERLAMPFPDARFLEIMPTIGDGIVHILTTHESVHLGQLSAWRRAAGLPPSRFMSFV